MIGRPKGRKGDAQARDDWTERLKRFAAAKNAKQRQAVIDDTNKINPGGTLRDLLNAWGYSSSTRGRKPKSAKKVSGSSKTARQRLEDTLHEMFGAKPSPVSSLYTKLSGGAPTTVKDAIRIVAALIYSWPEPLKIGRAGKVPAEAMDISIALAETFVRELLSELSSGRSFEWSDDEIKIRVFNLINEERVGITQFIKEAGEQEGALIVASAKNILLGQYPVDTIKDFHKVTNQFINNTNNSGMLIFIFNGAIFEAGKEAFSVINNIGLLSSALTAFALFPPGYDFKHPVQQSYIDWSRWRMLSQRCCVVVKRPTLIDPTSGKLLRGNKFDELIANWMPDEQFEPLAELDGFVRFESGHVLPRKYPAELDETRDLDEFDLYWDVLVRPNRDAPEGQRVEYFTPPPPQVSVTAKAQVKPEDGRMYVHTSNRGRPSAKTITIEEDFYYVIRRASPGPHYDDAQRTVFMAARGRLKSDSGNQHLENLNAAAALRSVGFEVLPISVMLLLLPYALRFAATKNEENKY